MFARGPTRGGALLSRYIPVVGRTFLAETLYGSKYSPHIGLYSMPFVYVKTVLLCAAGEGLAVEEQLYLQGMVEALLPSNASQDNLTKLELVQFIDAVPVRDAAAVNGGQQRTDDSASPARRADPLESLSSSFRLYPLEADGEGDEQSISRDLYGEAAAHLVSAAAEAAAVPHPQHCHRITTPMHASSSESSSSSSSSSSKVGGILGLPTAESMSSFINSSSFPGTLAHILLYDSISCCVADGRYSAKEKERVALVSSQIGLSSAVRELIERLALQEKVIAMKKARLLLLRQEDGKAAAATRSRSTPRESTTEAEVEEQRRQARRQQAEMKAHAAFLRKSQKLRPELSNV